MSTPGAGSRYLKEPFQCTHEQRIEAMDKIMALRFETMEKRLERIEAMIGSLERRLWTTVFGVAAVVLSEAAMSLIALQPK